VEWSRGGKAKETAGGSLPYQPSTTRLPMFDSIAVVGATGAVGRIILRLLEERGFPYQRIKFLASGRSAGKKIRFKGEEYTIEEMTPDSFHGVDIAIGSTPDETARDFCPCAVERGCIVV